MDLNEAFDLPAALAIYAAATPDPDGQVGLFEALLAGLDADPYGRSGDHGHFTGSAFVLSADGERSLLTHHRKLGLWLQPGGHADGDRDLRRVALREAEEETGLPGLRIDPEIFDLDRHWIPPRPGEPGHWHYDLRFLVHATGDEGYSVSPESHDLAWWPVVEIAHCPSFDRSLRRMASRWLARG